MTSGGATITVTPGSKGQTRAVTELSVGGMTCPNCARHVAEAIQSVVGVQSASVDLAGEAAAVRWKPGAGPDIPAVLHAVSEAGYDAKLKPRAADSHGSSERRMAGWRVNLWIGVIGTFPIMIGEWGLGLGMAPWFRWLEFALATVVQAVAGARFYRGAWNQLKVGSSSMDTLVALGSSTAYFYSVWALLSGMGGHLYFMEAAAIITLISLGHWIESKVSVRASDALRKLLDLAPATARRLDPDGRESEVPVAEVEVGELLVLRPGDRIPLDGKVEEGHSVVDESMLTGESVPVEKSAGSALYAGTLNVNGRLILHVTATGEETALSHIIAAVQRAQNSRAEIQRLGDRVSNVFVPVVVSIAVAAGLWWGLSPESAQAVHNWLGQFLWEAHVAEGPLAAAFIIASAVLIIACPCAMGLATPAAIMAGSNAAAQRGILIRDGLALEKAGKVTAVLFDKTGTLTAGKPELVETWSSEASKRPGFPAQDLAGALARHSTHPISLAVAEGTPDCSIDVRNWREVRGAGIIANFSFDEGQPESVLRFGSLSWLKESGVETVPGLSFVEKWSSQGATVVGLSWDRELRALFAVRDTLKAGSDAVVHRLKQSGFKIYMVTGDNSRTALSIARQCGIEPDNVMAEVRPESKADLVKKLQGQGERVAFIGDGINDAPALEQADLGIAVSRASDVAKEAADVILLKTDVAAVPESLGLARATLRTIKQNLFWAFFYNAVGVPLAALGFMSPILCAAAMGLSDLVVIGNALRLRAWNE
jgi:Cu+-exporting ATPase